jgi:hypothetical protein
MPNFSSLPATQTDLDTFLTIFQENFRVFQENSSAKFEKSNSWYLLIFVSKQRMFIPKVSSFYPDGLGQIFDLFSRKIQVFLKENSEVSKSENV